MTQIKFDSNGKLVEPSPEEVKNAFVTAALSGIENKGFESIGKVMAECFKEYLNLPSIKKYDITIYPEAYEEAENAFSGEDQ